MTTQRPDKFPDFAVHVNQYPPYEDGSDNDVTDPTTLQNNSVEPDDGKKRTGFLYNEKPPRQHFNWLFRKIAQWIRYLDSEPTILHFYVDLPGGTPIYSYSWTLPTGFTWDNSVCIGNQFRNATDAVLNWRLLPYNSIVNFGGVYILQTIDVRSDEPNPNKITVYSSSTDGVPAHCIDMAGYHFHLIIKKRP